MQKFGRELIREARRGGASDLEIVHGGKHPRLVGRTRHGRRFVLVFSGSPSCSRSYINSRGQLRRVLGRAGR